MRWGNAEALRSHRVLGFWPNTNIVHRIQPWPRAPWGLVWLGDEEDERRSIGMDSGCYSTFLDAYFESFAATELPIWRIFPRLLAVRIRSAPPSASLLFPLYPSRSIPLRLPPHFLCPTINRLAH